MGVEPFLLASSITAILAQRVLRKIDEKNVAGYVPEAPVMADIRANLGAMMPKTFDGQLKKGVPTPENNNSGYKGRVAIFEVIPVTEKIGRLILERAPASDIDKEARTEGMMSMKQDGYLKVVEGVTTIEEVLRVAQE
jgi:type II secretory ATPase GspE/PulE/Tfp pilus assembly ATPase PilB-like protein